MPSSIQVKQTPRASTFAVYDAQGHRLSGYFCQWSDAVRAASRKHMVCKVCGTVS